MLTVPPTTKLWFAAAVDLRLGFDGLRPLSRWAGGSRPITSCAPHWVAATSQLGRADESDTMASSENRNGCHPR